MSVVVVGVDHSAAAKAALGFAVEEAQLRQAPLRGVRAWQFGYIGAPGIEGSDPVLGGELDERRGAAGAALGEAPRGDPRRRRVEIERRVVEGAPGAVPVVESRAADLVVGSRGRGGFAELLLGSVSQQCAHHADCPVVIVPQKPGAH